MRRDWLFDYPAQCVLGVDQVFWTRNTHAALAALGSGDNPKAMQEHVAFSLRQIDAMIEIVRSDLTKLQRRVMGALIVLDVHARDVTRMFVKDEIHSTADYQWSRQLRYSWDSDVDDLVARQTNTKFRQAYSNKPPFAGTQL